MYCGRVTESQASLLGEIKARKSYMSIAGIINKDTLSDEQCIALLMFLVRKSLLLSLETGLGKTYVKAAASVAITNAYPGSKVLLFCTKNALEQIKKKFLMLTNLKVFYTTAEQSSLNNLSRNIMSHDVVLASHDCIAHPYFNKVLYMHKDSFKLLCLDESHRFTDPSTISGKILQGMIKHFEYKMFATATPYITSLKQTINQLLLLDDYLFLGIRDPYSHFISVNPDTGVEEMVNVDKFQNILKNVYYARTRKEIGVLGKHKPILELVEPHEHQKHYIGDQLFQTMKGPNAINQLTKLASVIIDHRRMGLKGLVYVDKSTIFDFIDVNFRSTNLRYAIINGKKNKDTEKRNEIVEAYQRGEYDVIFTNITESLDFCCDYVVFYELTTLFTQFIGRGERGFVGKDMDIIFILTKHSGEIDYFRKYIYSRSINIREVFGTDNSSIESLYSQM